MKETYSHSEVVDRIMYTAIFVVFIMTMIQLIISSTVYTKPSGKQRLHAVCEYLHGEVHGDICTVDGKQVSTRGQ